LKGGLKRGKLKMSLYHVEHLEATFLKEVRVWRAKNLEVPFRQPTEDLRYSEECLNRLKLYRELGHPLKLVLEKDRRATIPYQDPKTKKTTIYKPEYAKNTGWFWREDKFDEEKRS
jgi:hypothetical protein